MCDGVGNVGAVVGALKFFVKGKQCESMEGVSDLIGHDLVAIESESKLKVFGVDFRPDSAGTDEASGEV